MKDQLLLAQEITDCEQLFADDFTSSGLNEETQKHLDAHMEGVSPTSTSETPSANLSCDNVGVHISGAIASPSPSAPPSTLQRKQVSRVGVSKTGIKRGSYNCGRCGLPKKGHICTHIDTNNTPLERDRVITPSQSHSQSQSQSDSANTRILDRSGCTRNRSHPLVDTPSHSNVNAPHSYCASPAFHLARQTSSVCGAKRSLSMPRGGGGCPDEGKGKGKEIRPTHLNVHGSKRIHCGRSSASSSTPSYSSNRPALDAEMDSVDSTHLPDQSAAGLLSATCIVEIFKRLPPSSLLVATTVCTQWAQCARHVWSSVTDTQLLVTHHQKRCIPVMLKNCPNLMHLVLDVKSEIDDYLLRSIACSTHHLASLEIQVSHGGINMVTGDGLNDLLSECDSLYSLKLESCKAIRSLHLCSTHLATLWMADCYSIRTMFINCPSLTELSLDFAPEDDGSTDLCNVIENLSQSCPRLSRLHVSSVSLNNSVVLALASSNFRFLSMLSLTFGSGITDASVAALASSWNNLQMLDLSGSSITDRGLGIICSAFSGTMSKLLIALCRQISIAGLQMVVTQLPFLELLDCGMTIDYECHTNGNEATSLVRLQQEKYEVQQGGNILSKANTISNRLVIKHSRLKKLSLWGCSGIHGVQALYLDCPELVELNLNSCSSLSPENMLLQCPALLAVHAAYCEKVVTCAFQSKVSCSTEKETLHFSTKRMADGSKRVQAPQFDIIQPCEYGEVEEDVQKCLQGLTPPV